MTDQSKILVVDDEAFFRQLYHDLLSDAGYAVTVCASGEEAIALLQQQPVDLVLTDMVMPGKSGLDVLRTARAMPAGPDVVLVTGHASLDSAIEALKNGARDYLVKPFNPDELKHLIQTCIEQRRLLTENVHLRRQIYLFQTGQSLSSLIDLECLVPQALEVLLRELCADSGFSFSLPDGDEPCLTGSKNMPTERAEALLQLLLPEFRRAGGLACSTAASALVAQHASGPQGVWLLPLRDGESLKGGLVICNARSEADERSLADLRYLCDQIALGFANATRYRSAQQLMYADDLTGLYNHRYLQIALGQEMTRSKRYGLKFSFLFLDLDRFKEINDQFGHLAGSAALQEVGELMRNCVRDVDTLFRFGGDEFAAMLVETDKRAARVVAERIRNLIEKHVFLEHLQTPCQVTMTIGLATFPDDADTQEALLDLADQAMYAGKALRNRICSVDEIPSAR